MVIFQSFKLYTFKFCFKSLLTLPAEYYMRVDDMIFLMKKTRAGLKGDIYRWPDGVIPYTVQRGLRKIPFDTIVNSLSPVC